jgi:hypothetical protein
LAAFAADTGSLIRRTSGAIAVFAARDQTTAFIHHPITVIILAIAAYLFLWCDLAFTCSPTAICLTGAYSGLTFTYIQCTRWAGIAYFLRAMLAKSLTSGVIQIDLAIAIVVLSIITLFGQVIIRAILAIIRFGTFLPLAIYTSLFSTTAAHALLFGTERDVLGIIVD